MFNSPAVQDANSLVWFRLITEIPSFSAAEGCNPREKLRTYEALDVSCDPFAPRRQYQGQVTHAVITKGKARPELLERLEEAWARRKTYCRSPGMECPHWHTQPQKAISAVPAATTCLSLIKAEADINLPEDGP